MAEMNYRNWLDYALTDTMPEELPYIYDISFLYDYASSQQAPGYSDLQTIIQRERKNRTDGKTNSKVLSNIWATFPLRYNVRKKTGESRLLSLPQPLGCLNMALFNYMYGEELLLLLRQSPFSLRRAVNKMPVKLKECKSRTLRYTQPFDQDSFSVRRLGRYYAIWKYGTIAGFEDSREYESLSREYRFLVKTDIQDCFASMYTHTFSWIHTAEGPESKNMNRSCDLDAALDRTFENINASETSGLIVGPEFSRTGAEYLLSHVDYSVRRQLELDYPKMEYSIRRYVDDYYIFVNSFDDADRILKTLKASLKTFKMLLSESKTQKWSTPASLSLWFDDAQRNARDLSRIVFDANSSKKSIDGAFIQFRKTAIRIIAHYPNDRTRIVSYLISTLYSVLRPKKKEAANCAKKIMKSGSIKSILSTVFAICSFDPRYSVLQRLSSLLEAAFEEAGDEVVVPMVYSLLIEHKNQLFHDAYFADFANILLLCGAHGIRLPNMLEEDLIVLADNPLFVSVLMRYAERDSSSQFFQEVLQKAKSFVDAFIDVYNTYGWKSLFCHKESWAFLCFWRCPFIDQGPFNKIVMDIDALSAAPNLSHRDKDHLFLIQFIVRAMKTTDKGVVNWGRLDGLSRVQVYCTDALCALKHMQDPYFS